jgi:hypothetical protein
MGLTKPPGVHAEYLSQTPVEGRKIAKSCVEGDIGDQRRGRTKFDRRASVYQARIDAV